MHKTALVTGASAGIGEATVKRFLADGYIVYAAARRLDRMAPLASAGARLLSLDLTEDSSIVASVEKIPQRNRPARRAHQQCRLWQLWRA